MNHYYRRLANDSAVLFCKSIDEGRQYKKYFVSFEQSDRNLSLNQFTHIFLAQKIHSSLHLTNILFYKELL